MTSGRLKLYTIVTLDGNSDPVYVEYVTTNANNSQYFDIIESSK